MNIRQALALINESIFPMAVELRKGDCQIWDWSYSIYGRGVEVGRDGSSFHALEEKEAYSVRYSDGQLFGMVIGNLLAEDLSKSHEGLEVSAAFHFHTIEHVALHDPTLEEILAFELDVDSLPREWIKAIALLEILFSDVKRSGWNHTQPCRRKKRSCSPESVGR
jgi:hypothetical protein